MYTDKTGFLYPVAEPHKCTNCHLCEKVCPILCHDAKRTPSYAYAAWNNNEKIRLASSSGGFFSAIAESIIEVGGVVYGAVFDEQWNLYHCAIESKEDLPKLRGSKYLQSNIGNCYKEIKKHLKDNRKVLFCGTPCQVAGLKHFLHQEYEGLTTLDFICHGVPNPRMWKNYLTEFKLSPKSINFRDKSKGWLNYRFSLILMPSVDERQPTSISQHHCDNLYMKLFLENYILRPSCHSCHFRNGKSGADFTMGDYWGIWKSHPEMDDDKGISLIFQYTKPIETFSNISKTCTINKTSIQAAIDSNPAYIRNWTRNRLSPLFYFLHDKLSFSIQKSWSICHYLSYRFPRLFTTP